MTALCQEEIPILKVDLRRANTIANKKQEMSNFQGNKPILNVENWHLTSTFDISCFLLAIVLALTPS